MLRPLDTEELRKAVKPAPSKEFVVSKPPVIWLAMQTHSLARIADSTVWLTLQTQWSDSKCRLNSLTHDADSTVWQRSNCKNATQQGEEPGSKWWTPLLLNFPGNLFGFPRDPLIAHRSPTGWSLAQNGGLPCFCSPETFNSGLSSSIRLCAFPQVISK